MTKNANNTLDLVVVGSIGLDTIETTEARRENILGGSVSYACAAASFFTKAGMVGVVGDDFPEEHTALYRHFGIDLDGLQRAAGKTFAWSGVYEADMNNRSTLSTDLNVFADFMPELPAAYAVAPYLFLANISPELQLHVLDEATSPHFVVANTMDLWINIARDKLMEVIGRVNMLTLNDSELRLLTGENNLVKAAKTILDEGPDYVVVKKGEHGAMLFGEDEVFIVPAYPLDAIHDPTGAGDSFAGGFMGSLVDAGVVDTRSVRRALVAGSVVASFCCEAFSLDRFHALNKDEIDERYERLKAMTHIHS